MSVTPSDRPISVTTRGRGQIPVVSGASLWLGDSIFRFVSMFAALTVPLVVIVMFVFLAYRSMPILANQGTAFLLGQEWALGERKFGALPLIYGTLVTSFLAMLIAVPLGVGAAAYLAEVASGTVRRIASFLIELLAAVPSVVYGFWGLLFIAPQLQHLYAFLGFEGADITGKGLVTCSLLLAIMIVPFITAITFDVCRSVPTAQRQGALALGATRWQTIFHVVLPYARPGIIGGCFLALGRAIGETMAVAMVIGNNAQIRLSIRGLMGHGYSIPSVMANEWDSAQRSPLQTSAIIALGLVLFLVTVIVNVLARLMIWNMTRRATTPKRPAPLDERKLQPSDNGVGSLLRPAVRPTRTVPLVSSLHNVWAKPINSVMTWVMFACIVVIVVPLFHILGYVTYQGITNVSWTFFTHDYTDEPKGLGHAVLGTLYMVSMATLVAVPIGILAALYLTEYPRSRINSTVRFLNELLSGIPSVVLGIFVYTLVVIHFHDSAYAGSLALGIMMVPIVMRASEEALKLVPLPLRNASYALGASHWQTVYLVILPASLPAIITGVFLSIARIAGETAPLLFTAGASNYWPRGLNDKTPFLTYYIYNGALEGATNPVMAQLAWGGAFVLLSFVMVLNIGIRILAGARVVSASRAD